MNPIRVEVDRIDVCRFVVRDESGSSVVLGGNDAVARDILSRTPNWNPIDLVVESSAETREAMRPMHALLGAVCVCGAIDLLLILAKQREPARRLRLTARGDRPDSIPAPFASIQIAVGAPGVSAERLEAAAQLAFRKYCSVGSSLDPSIALDITVLDSTSRGSDVASKESGKDIAR